MRVIGADDVRTALDYPSLIERLRGAFRARLVAPPRHHHRIERGDRPSATLLLMPAWQDLAESHGERGFIGMKSVTVFPDNPGLEQPMATVMGVYLLLSGRTGEPLALIDGPELTLWRTAAASALAAGYLARPDASRLLIVGAGPLAFHLARAHAAVRPINEILVWNRTPQRAADLVRRLARLDLPAKATEDLEGAVRAAHLISCATMSDRPLVHGAWLAGGVHVDLVGAFRPDLRESDDQVMRRGRIFVDTREGALAEAGDIIQPIEAGVIGPDDIAADLVELARGDRAGRRYYDQITVFKSVGHAIEDLAAATLVFERA